MIRILVVDDQNIVREGIKMLLEKAKGIAIVGEAKDGNSALQKISALQPDIILLDIEMPGISGLTVADQISLQHPQIKVIMLSTHEDAKYVQQATALGAKGYLLKNVSSQELEWSIRLVAQGYSTIKSELLAEQLSYSNEPQHDFLSMSTHDSAHVGLHNGEDTPEKSFASVAALSEKDRANIRQLETLLTHNKVEGRNPRHQRKKPRKKKKKILQSTNALKLKRTVSSFEFKLLVFIIIFSLGFLVFIALS